MNSLTNFTKNNVTLKNFNFRAGDEVAVSLKTKDGGKEKISTFDGLVLKRNHGQEAGATFTVRKLFGSISVERIFPLHSPLIDNVKVLKSYKVRRAKLFYLREAQGKKSRLKLVKTS